MRVKTSFPHWMNLQLSALREIALPELTVRVIKNGKVEFPNVSDAAPTLQPSNPTIDAKRQLVEKKL
jgi:hypothetical protein